ncbi:MAG: hypothetical protein IJK07_03345 [Bacteroidales bacterium]|nr:hypothetical protein [Bacteroidales bacterium]
MYKSLIFFSKSFQCFINTVAATLATRHPKLHFPAEAQRRTAESNGTRRRIPTNNANWRHIMKANGT